MTDPDARTGSEHPDHRGDGGYSVPYGSDPGASEDARTTRSYPSSSSGYEQAYGQQPLRQQGAYGQQQPPYDSAPSAYAPHPGEFAPPRGLSITSFVLGVVSLLFWFSLLVPIAGLVLGFAGLRREPAGRGFAIAGIIINGVFVLLAVLAIVFVVLLFLGALGSIPFFLDQSTGTSGLPA
jgi:hypothetical protein